MSIEPLLRGFGLSGALIVAIGAQNAFVLRQGLKREHVFLIALTCSVWDASMIALGVGGIGRLISAHPSWIKIAMWSGAAFLTYYGFRAFRAALTPGKLDVREGAPLRVSRRKIIAQTLAFSALNPHVYLDTVVLLGGIAGQYHESSHRLLFGVGAGTASFVWFFGLAYGAAKLAPLFRKPAAWRVLDAIIGAIMWTIAFTLVL